MAVLATDSFNRADGNLTTPWSNSVGGFAALAIASNVVKTSSGNADSEAVYDGSITWPDDQYSQVTISTVGGSDGGPCVRAGTGDGYFVTAFSGSHISLFRISGFSSLAEVVGSYNVGDVIRIEAEGTTIRVKQNAATIINITNSAVASGKPGIHLFDSAIRVDDWEGGDFSAGDTLMGQVMT